MAGAQIIIEPKKLWDYVQKHKSRLGATMFEIAKNEQYGISIYLSETEQRCPCITVEADDSEVYSERIVSETDAEKTCSKIYDEYLTDKVVDVLTEMTDDEEESLLEQQDAIEEREMELDIAVSEFISAVLGGDAYLDGEDYGDIIEDCKDHFLEYLARKHGLDIFRPMVLEDEDGEEFYEEFPYDCMEFDDEDNPIYQP